jgi:hypothetical protein
MVDGFIDPSVPQFFYGAELFDHVRRAVECRAQSRCETHSYEFVVSVGKGALWCQAGEKPMAHAVSPGKLE